MNQQKLNTAPEELETVSGIVDSIIYQNEENGYIVCELEDTEGHPVTVTGIIPYLAEGDKITYAGVNFTVLHTPGHTPGCVCYQAGEWLFTGDTLFHYGYGRTDLPGGNMRQLAESLRRLQPLVQQYEIFPGH